jgi:polyphosphate:AMP phosphotransferase
VDRSFSSAAFDGQLDRIAAFEQTLTDDGAQALKFWIHLGRKALKKRLEALSEDPLTRWRVTGTQWKEYRQYHRLTAVAERMIQRTSFGHAPWVIIDGTDERYRNLAVGTAIRDVLYRALGATPASPASRARPRKAASARAARPEPELQGVVARVDRDHSVLDSVDMTPTLSKEAFKIQLLKQQGRLHRFQRKAAAAGHSIIMVFEGWDAAGKGGAIRRVTSALHPQVYQVIPVAAPTDEERAHHYLWRFWRHLSRAGGVTIFDRSWYGRVLVERVEAFASHAEWSRAYAEIRHFEEQLVEHGIVLLKYWIHITPDEQEKRFKERAASPYKSWKLTADDWRNREKWDAYELAVNDMVEETSTSAAPWHLIAGNDKNYARVEILRRAADAIAAAL